MFFNQYKFLKNLRKVIPNYRLTKVRNKLYTFCISPAQSQHNNIKATLHKALF